MAIVCSGTALFLSPLYYSTLGRISNFAEITPGSLPGTNYVIERSGEDLVLRNTVSQSTTNLAFSAWTTASPAPVVVNGQYTVTNPITGTQQFYRLSQ